MCKNGWSGPEYNLYLDRAWKIGPKDTWDSRHQNRNLSRRFIHHDTTVIDSKGHKSWLPTQESRTQDQSPVLHR